jgi:heme a synthase
LVLRSDLVLHRYTLGLAAATLVLIFVGGLVTSTGSGLAVPDWPLSYGKLFPPMVGGVLFEHGHRMVAAAVGFLTFVLAVWVWRRPTRPWVRRLATLALVVVIGQGVLGGITVLFLLPPAVSIAHAGLAQVFFCLTIALVAVTSPAWTEERTRIADPGIRRLANATTAVVYGQILLGAWMRHTGSGLAIPDFPLAYGRLVPPFFTRQILIHFAHRAGAVVVVVFVAWLATRILTRHREEPALARAAWTLICALLLQILLGAETIWSSRGVLPTTLHVAGGAATLAAALWLRLALERVVHREDALAGAAAPAAAEQQL